MGEFPNSEPLDLKERHKRKREGLLVFFLGIFFIILTVAEFRLTRVSTTLPFVNSIFFFGLLNVNLIILIALVWLIFRNIGKVFLERRRKILGSRLKTKLIIAFLGFSVIPTLVLFVISAMYINSSFDKWFSIKIQNTLQASLEITRTYYRNTDQTAMHFAEHLASGIGKRVLMPEPAKIPGFGPTVPAWISGYLTTQRELLALDAVEFYVDPLEERVLAQRANVPDLPLFYPTLSLDLVERAFAGEKVSVIQHIGSGDLIRCVVPVRAEANPKGVILGVLAVNSYIPVSLVNKVDEIASVFDDYKDTNPLKYPMKTTYFVILIMITLVILFVAIWIGLYMARELTVPVERLVLGAQQVGAGNLDVTVLSSGHDEIATLIQSFNKMTSDLKENSERLSQASSDLERRRLQLEAVLANVGAGVVSVDSAGKITTFNPAASRLLQIEPQQAISYRYDEVFRDEAKTLAETIERALLSAQGQQQGAILPDMTQWNYNVGNQPKVLSAIATPLRESESNWGVVAVLDDMTHLIKGQREMAWREVARRIAHEIKNPLTPIKLSAQRLQRRLSHVKGNDGALLQECTDTIIQHTDELKEMVNEFSSFARLPEASPAPYDLNEALREVISLYQQAHPDVSFNVMLEPKVPTLEFDREQIKRVAINLLDNAIAALHSLTNLKNPLISIATHFNAQLKMVVIEVGDNGPGMTDEVRGRVFEPYFSTKTEGTGLGLAIAKRIVNDHNGFIRVQSAPGQGTRFLIELPTALRNPPQKG